MITDVREENGRLRASDGTENDLRAGTGTINNQVVPLRELPSGMERTARSGALITKAEWSLNCPLRADWVRSCI